jgi:hypothetical protein
MGSHACEGAHLPEAVFLVFFLVRLRCKYIGTLSIGYILGFAMLGSSELPVFLNELSLTIS